MKYKPYDVRCGFFIWCIMRCVCDRHSLWCLMMYVCDEHIMTSYAVYVTWCFMRYVCDQHGLWSLMMHVCDRGYLWRKMTLYAGNEWICMKPYCMKVNDFLWHIYDVVRVREQMTESREQMILFPSEWGAVWDLHGRPHSAPSVGIWALSFPFVPFRFLSSARVTVMCAVCASSVTLMLRGALAQNGKES